MIDKDHIIANLREVFDPEISINVYDLGLIYNVETCTAEYSVDITHTLTSAFCPFADEIISNIRQAGLVDNVRIVNVITTFEPPFTVDSVPEETRAMMGW
jgi:metal-sulfur cluster biosynthetic enzyme|tara:strand:- start:1416 stop:1715 length:300 start_codon:yes stop_codon:yes gene_type:complete